MVVLGSKMIGLGTNTNSENHLWVRKLVLVQELSPNPRIEIHIHFLSMATGINVGSGNWSKLGKDTRVNIDSKMVTESQDWRSGSHSHSSSISLNEKLANFSKV